VTHACPAERYSRPSCGNAIRPPFEVADEAMMALAFGGGRTVPSGTIRYAAPFGV
jgi:hypothetical protein